MKKSLLSAAFSLAVVTTAFPWGNPGHMAVASVAYDELSPAERAKIVALLKKHPDLSPVRRNFDGSPTDRELFLIVSTWPDMIRDDSAYTLPPDHIYEENEPAVTNVDYTAGKKKHMGWHFTDSFFWRGKGQPLPLPETPKVNAVGVIKVLIAQLHSNETKEEKAFDLVWLFHLVGDMHQPLHAASAVTGNLRGGDHGGNAVHLSNVDGEKELHNLWDHLPGKASTSTGPIKWLLKDDVQTADNFKASLAGVPLEDAADSLDPSVWAAESLTIAKRDAYNFASEEAGKTGPNAKPHVLVTLVDGYQEQALRDARLRVKTAGHRLALILQKVAAGI